MLSQPHQENPDQVTLMIGVAAWLPLIMGVATLLGWVRDIPLLKSVLPGAVEMQANTALGLIAASLALWLLARQRPALVQQAGQTLALLVTALGLAALAQYLFGWQLGMDAWRLPGSQGGNKPIRGQLSPYSALAFACLGWSLLLLPRHGPRALASLAATLTLMLGTLSALGYVWSVNEFTTDILLPPMALNSAVAFVFLGTGALLAIRKRRAQQTASPFLMTSMEGKILAGFAASFLLLAIGGGLSYKTTKLFAGSAQAVAKTQQVRAALGRLYADMSDAGMSQRNYLITGRIQQLYDYRKLSSQVARQTDILGFLVSDNVPQLENLAALRPLTDQARELLDRSIEVYQAGGFARAKKLIDAGEGMAAMQSIVVLIKRMEHVEESLLVEREAAFARLQNYMLVSLLLTIVAAACIFAMLYRGIRREMRARQLADQALVSARDAAELSRKEADAANHAKSNFLATMSHEIRTPMNGVLGMLEILSLTHLDDSQHSAVKVIRESGKSLIGIVDDILDFSKIEAQKLDLHPEAARLKDVMDDVYSIYAGNASSKDLLLSCRIDPALSPALMVDAVRLRQILSNFVSNAIKFTSHGQVEITAELMARSQGQDRVRFCVKDSGIGISEAHQRHLFQPFAQAETSTTRRYGGTGLGLAICRRLADLMGGSIDLVSAAGQGTTMILELSLPIADPASLPVSEPQSARNPLLASISSRRKAPDVAQAAAEGTLVLLVDDHPTNRSLLQRQLNLLGYAAESARNGREALGLWESGRFALLLTDCNMPEMDGYELARALRAREATSQAGRAPIIACSANALAGEAEICRNAGMDDYLVKPVELKNLLAKLERWLPLPAASVTPPEKFPALRQASTAIDHAALARVSAGDARMEREIFIEFQQANDKDAARLKQAVIDKDGAEVTRLTHLIKGACAMVGALTLSGVCERLARANRSGDWNAVAASMNEFHQEVADLNHYFSGFNQALPQAAAGPDSLLKT